MHACMHACTYIHSYINAKFSREWGRVGWMLADHWDGLLNWSFIAWSSIALSICQRAFSLLEIRFQRSWVRILHSAEADNLPPFDSKIVCLCQSIEINNKHVYRQRQVRKSTGSGFELAECSLTIGKGYWVQVYFSLILGCTTVVNCDTLTPNSNV